MKSNKSQDYKRQVKKAGKHPALHCFWRMQKIWTQIKQMKTKIKNPPFHCNWCSGRHHSIKISPCETGVEGKNGEWEMTKKKTNQPQTPQKGKEIFPSRFDRKKKVHGLCTLRLSFSLHHILNLLDLETVNKAKNHWKYWKMHLCAPAGVDILCRARNSCGNAHVFQSLNSKLKNAGSATSFLGERFN